MSRRLGRGEVDVWYVRSDLIDDQCLLRTLRALLADDELAGLRHFASAVARREYLVSRGLVRACLSSYANVAPRAWVFVRGEYGRPEIEFPRLAPPLRFSLTHTTDLIACAVTLERDVGVDAEECESRRVGADADFGIAEASAFVLSRAELTALHDLPRDARQRRFFEYWTLKESYAKARGVGLSLPLTGVSFELGGGRQVRASFARRVSDDVAAWYFALFRPSPRHVMAASVHRCAREEVAVRLLPTYLELVKPSVGESSSRPGAP